MLFGTILKVALRSLFAHKLRSFLAMLGIIIGVGAVVSMLALGTGAQKNVMTRLSAMGTNLLVVRPGQTGSRGVASGTSQRLTVEDAYAIVDGVKGVKSVSPMVRGSGQLKYMNKNSRTSVIGCSVTYLPIRDFVVEKGRAFTEVEAERNARVVVLGPKTVEDLFETESPLEKVIKINGMNFRVVGVLKSKGDQGWFNPDDQAVIPYTTAMKQLFGLEYIQEIDIQVADVTTMSKMQDDTTALLRKRHRLQTGAPDDFSIRNQAEMLETAESFTRTFTILLGGIAGISLLVGGIGIMNIMLVTVTERTREIGVRKAIGARDRDILQQFLIEAVLMSALGGIVGALLGVSLAKAIESLTQFATVVTPVSIILALSFSAAVGIFFGYYPAWRASKLDPIDALRYE
jgi:putative ABC transport system permease protein